MSSQTLKPSQIIIIDASNEENRVLTESIKDKNIIYRISNIRSAAIQRNIALDLVDKKNRYVAILDDDILITPNYLERCLNLIQISKAIGISGVAIPTKKVTKTNKLNLIKRLFFLESKFGGLVTAGGINLPIKTNQSGSLLFETKWLIGCAFWDNRKLGNLRFCNEFLGQSLFEDVLFSIQASKMGTLLVDSTLVLQHLEAETSRPNLQEFYFMWVVNRYEVIRNLDKGPLKYAAFHWTNLGKFGQLTIRFLLRKEHNILPLIGFIKGYLKLIGIVD